MAHHQQNTQNISNIKHVIVNQEEIITNKDLTIGGGIFQGLQTSGHIFKTTKIEFCRLTGLPEILIKFVNGQHRSLI